MFILKLLGKLFKALRSGASPNQIAGGFIFGMIIGLTPFWSLHNLLVVILIIILKVNISMAIFSFLICSGFAYLLDPIFHSFGYWLLVDVTSLQGLWTSLYNTPVVPLTRYNNTVVMGSLVSSLILTLPMFFLVKVGVVLYREKFEARIQKLKIVQIVKSSKIYSVYQKISDFRD
jgi:uncharacterized protein (TIGR03546 family)